MPYQKVVPQFHMQVATESLNRLKKKKKKNTVNEAIKRH